jgi:capsid protein
MFGLTPPKLRMVRAPRAAQPPARIIRAAARPDPRLDWGWDDGSKWQGGFGPTRLLFTDYWSLRNRSVDLFETNLYARGIIRRLVTNEINTGLNLEAVPEEVLLGLKEDSLADWSENVENRFALWANEPALCDYAERSTFGALQVAARMEALISGDVLIVNRVDQRTGLPKVQLISGSCVQSPFPGPAGVRIDHGVERDAQGRHVAYWITQQVAGTIVPQFRRLPAYGEKSGRRLAWLLYGTDKKLDDVRGKPILALVLQSLKEIDRYRDSVQRKAVINSMVAMFLTKTQDKPGTRSISGGAIRRGTETTTAGDGTGRSFRIAEQIPGMVFEELQQGEEPKGFPSTGTDERFGAFEEAVIQAVAWANEIPPEILTLSFNSNYSASQAAINEFKMYLNRVRTDFGDCLCTPIYREWLLAEVAAKRVEARGLLEAFRDPSQYDVFGAWVASDWSGHIKPAVDLSKLVAGYTQAIEQGLMTRARAARELFGMRFSKAIQQLERENQEVFEANRWLAELKAMEKAPQNDGTAATPAKPGATDTNAEPTDEDGTEVPAARGRAPLKAIA